MGVGLVVRGEKNPRIQQSSAERDISGAAGLGHILFKKKIESEKAICLFSAINTATCLHLGLLVETEETRERQPNTQKRDFRLLAVFVIPFW